MKETIFNLVREFTRAFFWVFIGISFMIHIAAMEKESASRLVSGNFSSLLALIFLSLAVQQVIARLFDRFHHHHRS